VRSPDEKYLQNYMPRDVGGPITIPQDDGSDDGFDSSANVVDLNLASDADRLSAAKDARGDMARELADDIKKFARALIADLQFSRDVCSQQKLNRNLPRRWTVNDRRAVNGWLARYKANGEIDETWEDGYAELGITLAWGAQAINTSGAYMSNRYFNDSPRFYATQSIGRSPENKDVAASMDAFTDVNLRQADFEKWGRRRFYQKCKHGTSIMRYELISKLEYKLENGAMVEKRGKPTVWVQVWPIEDFECTNIDRADASRQEGVFWISRQRNANDLSANEATYDFDTDDEGDIQTGKFRRVKGKFFGLDRVRSLPPMTYKIPVPVGDPRSTTPSRNTSTVSNLALFDLIEYQGTIARAVFEEFTPKMAAFWGIDVGMPELMDVDPKDSANRDVLDEFRARLTRVPMWQVSFPNPDNATGDVSDMLLEFDIRANGRNSAYFYRYGEDGDEVYGRGIVDYADPLERIGTAAMNAALRLAMHDSKPSVLANRNLLDIPTKGEVRNLFRSGNIIDSYGAAKLEDVLQVMKLNGDIAGLKELAMYCRESYFEAGRVLPAIMGGAQANTAEQDSFNRESAQSWLDESILSDAREDYRFIRDFWEDLWNELGRDEFLKQVREAAGFDAANLDDEIQDFDQFMDHYFLDHPNTFGKDPMLLSAAFDNKSAVWMQSGAMDLPQACQTSFGFIYPNADSLMMDGFKPVSPKQEVSEMIAGHNILPTNKMQPQDLQGRLTLYAIAMKQLEAGQFPSVLGVKLKQSDAQNLYQRLSDYTEVGAEIFAQLQMSLMGGSSQPIPGMGNGAQGTGNGGAGNPQPAANPRDQKQGLNRAARKVPGERVAA
jgi:hypothetical protein